MGKRTAVVADHDLVAFLAQLTRVLRHVPPVVVLQLVASCHGVRVSLLPVILATLARVLRLVHLLSVAQLLHLSDLLLHHLRLRIRRV